MTDSAAPAATRVLWPPPLLAERPLPVQIFLVGVLPIAFGALCGYELGASAVWFQILMLLAGLGGIAGGFEHASPRSGFLRGLAGGAIFIGSLVVTFKARGAPALAPLPAGLAVTAVVYAAGGMPLGALGGWLRRRSMARRSAVSAAGHA